MTPSRKSRLLVLPSLTRDSAFEDTLSRNGLVTLTRGRVTTLQVNVGRLCNLACHHCHVEAGPKRTESLSAEVADRLLELLAVSPGIEVLDLTGGAPEMSSQFRRLVGSARALGRRVIDRCNLTILEMPGHEDLADFLASEEVEIVASLPCYTEENVDQQRGRGAFDDSTAALQRLNRLGYGKPGKPGSALRLDLVYNPLGPSLPPAQGPLELDYKRELGDRFGIEFHNLLTITNMPIRRFAEQLARLGKTEVYQALLVNHFNPATVDGLMCRSQVSVDWLGRLYDCDFNLMLDLPLPMAEDAHRPTIWDLDTLQDIEGTSITTASHCFGCTAGAGSSCSGALA